MTREGASLLLEAVTVRFGAHVAVDAATLRVEAGECVGLVGPSGAGKTTLLRCLNATVRPDAGRVAVGGRELSRLSAREFRGVRASVGFVHQDFGLVPNLRVAQNVLCGRLGRRSLLGSLRSVFLPRRAELQEVDALLERVGIAEKIFERTDRLSGGQRQRVAIARTLAQEPAALLADEPVSAVDPARARDTVGLLVDLARDRGIPLVASLHDLPLAREFFPRLVGMRHGRIAFDGPTETIDAEALASLYHLGREEILDDGP